MNQITIDKVECVDGQYNKYARKPEFKKFWLRNGNLIWGKHADLSFPLNALYFGNLELCCDDEWPEVNQIFAHIEKRMMEAGMS